MLTTAQLWLLLVTIGLAVTLQFLAPLGSVTAFEPTLVREQVTSVGAAAMLLATVVVPVGVYRERDGAAPGQWRPSAAYYLAALPLAGALPALGYLIQRARSDG